MTIETFVTVDDRKTRVLEEGRGRCVILLHGGGLGSSADDWGALVPALAARGFRALAFDQPGFGVNDDPPEHSLAYRERFLLAVLDVLGIDRATLVGHSQSGRVALGVALNAPTRVEGAVIVCTSSLLPPLGARREEFEIPAREPTPDETRAQLEADVYRRDFVTADLVARRQRFSIGRNFSNAVKRVSAMRDPMQAVPSNWGRLADPSAPLMLIYGMNDKGSVAERIVFARDRYPQLPIHGLEECGHYAHWDQPEAVIQLIADFASRLPPARP